MIERRFGHIPDRLEHVAEDLVARPLTRAKVGGVALPAVVSFLPWVDKVRDQGSVGCCVGEAFAAAIDIRSRMLGIVSEHPSPLAIYTAARLEDLEKGEALIDDGCRPRAAIERIRDASISCLVSENDWPLKAELVNEPLPLDVYQKADGLAVDWFRVPGAGDERFSLLLEALAAGYPVAFATSLDEGFRSYEGGPYTPTGPSIGNHMMLAIGYSSKGVLVLNSWGEGFGDGGFVHFTREAIGSARCFDFYAITTGLE